MDPFKPYQPRTPSPPFRLSPDDAEAVALKALAHIAADETLLPRFVALTGCGLDEVRRRVADRAFLAGVLDFLLADEAAVLAFAGETGLAPEAPLRARHILLPEAE